MRALLLILLLAAAPASAQDGAAGTKMPTRQELNQPSRCALWTDAEAVAAETPLKTGQAYILTLVKTEGSYGGQMPLTIERGAVYSVAADGAATVDIVSGNDVAGSLVNTDTDVCGNGTAFTLPSGAYTIRIRKAAKAAFKLLLIEK